MVFEMVRRVVTDMFWLVAVFVCAVIIYLIWQAWELSYFNRTHYEIRSDKLKEAHKWVVVADLHLWLYGRHNERLIEAIREEKPEAIFVPGDLIVHTKPELFFVAEELMEQLTKVAPVFFSNGNHESRLEDQAHSNHIPYRRLETRMSELGVHILNNGREPVREGMDELVVLGLELPLSYYKKGVDTPLAPEELTRCLGEPDDGRYQILLAHTPKYVPEYLAWGADLCLCGHYHGGLVCLPGIGSVISPQFELFPKYSFGRFDEGSRTALISRGMGTHTFHVRVFNRSELLVVTAGPKEL